MIEKSAPGRTHRKTLYPWKDLADTCRATPGEWFRMPVGNRVYASFAKQGRYTAFGENIDDWEFTTRKEDGDLYLYARYRAG